MIRIGLAGDRRRARAELEDEEGCETEAVRDSIDDEILRRDLVAGTAKGEGHNRVSVAS